jgi:hypothetical protein
MKHGQRFVIAQVNMMGSKSNAIVDEGRVAFTLNAMHGHDVHAILTTTEEPKTVNDANDQLSMFSSEAHHAKVSRWLDFGKECKTREETSRLSILQSLTNIGPIGWYGKTSPVSCRQTQDGILEPLSGAWSNSGIARPGECLTLSTSEFHSDAAVCSLSDVLETGEIPQKYFLSQKACKGILRRAEKRGKKLPEPLQVALTQVAGRKT